jgi:glycosyltransferase involved in cell wall biosynthesis
VNKHILVVSQYFYPEEFRINDICQEWVKRGYKVTVVTGIPNYPGGKFFKGYGLFSRRKENHNGIEIIRLPILPRLKNPVTLSLNYLSFVVSGYLWKLTTKINADYVFVFEVSPMTQALPGVWYARKNNIPCYLYVQDLWPENVEAVAGITNGLILNAIGRMVDYIYRHCSMIFVPSRSFAEAIRGRGVPEGKIEYWPQYAEDFYKPLDKNFVSSKKIPQDGVFNITFAGNIGYAQGLEILPRVAANLKQRGYLEKIRFNIIGDGRYKDTLMDIVVESGVDSMFNFIPRQPARQIPELMATSDAALLCLADSSILEMTIPAKLQSYLACGLPIIASASGETKRIVLESEAGVCCNPGDYVQLADVIVDLSSRASEELQRMGDNARKYYDEHFAKNRLFDRMDYYFGA